MGPPRKGGREIGLRPLLNVEPHITQSVINAIVKTSPTSFHNIISL